MKNISLQKGLFRIYLILSFCGFICMGIAIYNGVACRKNHDSCQSYLEHNAKYIEELRTGDESKVRPSPFEEDIFTGNRAHKALGDLYDNAYMYYGGLTAKYAKEKAVLYTYAFLLLSVAPWALHYIVQIVFVPIVRWIIKGFKT